MYDVTSFTNQPSLREVNLRPPSPAAMHPVSQCSLPPTGRPWWLLFIALPFYGITTGLAFGILAYRRRSAALMGWAAMYAAVVAVAFALTPGTRSMVVLLPLVWVVGTVHLAHSISQGPAVERWRLDPDLEAARERLERRDGAKAIARENPALAREAGIGRPGSSWGVLDLNRASACQIVACLDLSPAEADLVVEVRGTLGRFSSLDEVAALADLGPVAASNVADRGILL